MKLVVVSIIVFCATINAAPSWVATLENGEHKWLAAKVSDIGSSGAADNKRYLKLKVQYWVITARLPEGTKLSAGESVEIKQDGNTLLVKTATGKIACRLVCIQKVVYAE
jgi:hypothetical protein